MTAKRTPKRTLSLRPDPGGTVPETAMVMAAGIGKRMRPLTATRPKPLIQVAGQTLLDHVFDRLRAAGIKRAVVNVHYLADALEAHLKNRVKGVDIVVSDERDQLMETGGGIVKARDLIGDKPFVVANADNLWVDGPADTIKLLASRWDDDLMDALLLVVPLARAHNHGGLGDFHLDANGRITGREMIAFTAGIWYHLVQYDHTTGIIGGVARHELNGANGAVLDRITYLTASNALDRASVRRLLHVAQVCAGLPHRDVVYARPDDAAIVAGDRHRAGGGAGCQPR